MKDQQKPKSTIADTIVKHVIGIVILFFIAVGFYACDNPSTDSKFVGQWCYCRNGSTNNDAGSSRNCIASVTKMENTSQSYMFKMSYFYSLTQIFTKQDENTLVAIDGTGHRLRYIDSTEHIFLINSDSTTMEFSRLK